MAGRRAPHERTGVGFGRQTQQATVTEVEEVSRSAANASGVPPTGDTSTAEGSSAQQQEGGICKKATVRVDTGKDKGRTFTEIVQPDQSRQLHEGEKVVVAYEPSAPKDLQYAEEIVRTLVGSIGLVASVPVTTALAALVVSADHSEREPAMAGAQTAPGRGGRGGGARGEAGGRPEVLPRSAKKRSCTAPQPPLKRYGTAPRAAVP